MSVEKLALTTEAVIDKYADMVYRVAVNATGSKEDAEDVFQDVFLRLVRCRNRISNESHLKSWLLRVTVNCARKQQGSAWNRRVSFFSDHTEEAADLANQHEYERVENVDSPLAAAIEQLPEGYRLVIDLFYYEELSIAQIGKLLGEKEASVKTKLHRARGMLRRKLEGEVSC